MAPTLKSKKVSQSAKKEDVEWVLEGIVGYLGSPAWNVPIMNFFDDNCSCFEDKDENKFEYTDIHIKYKALVEELIAKYIRELNISEDLFSQACNLHTSAIHGLEGMFEYIWAADDFLLFKRLMIKHNLDLEMQALNLMQAQDANEIFQGLEEFASYNPKYMHMFEPSTPQSSHSSKTNQFSDDNKQDLRKVIDLSQEEYDTLIKKSRELEEKEAMDLKRAIEFSKLEMERLNAQAEEEKRMLEEAIRLSLEFANFAKDDHQEKPAAVGQIDLRVADENCAPTTARESKSPASNSSQNAKSDAPLQATKSYSGKSKQKPSSTAKNISVASLPPLRQKSSQEAALDWLASAQLESNFVAGESQPPAEDNQRPEYQPSAKPGIDPAKLAQRKLYLQQQRDKLLAAKKKEREEDLRRYQNESPERKQVQEEDTQDADKSSAEAEKIVNARRALADRLKREVIQQKK